MTQLSNIERSVGKVEGTQDEILRSVERLHMRFDATEKRMRKVENRMHWWSGVGGTVGAILGVLFGHRIG